MLRGKKILLGVTGGIAAYKAVELLRLLAKEGADVTVVMTEHAKRFVGPLTFQTLSGKPVADDLFASRPGPPIEHLALAQEADLVIIAPATANFIAKMAAGLADDILSTLLLAVQAPVLVAPAMNTHMIRHPATRANLATLAARGIHIVPPESGALAAEAAGYGRLAAIKTIHEAARGLMRHGKDLAGRRIIVTAGPTREAIDPVRFLSNRSSGKMGIAIAAAARDRGADVTLVAGPLQVIAPADIPLFPVTTAAEMREAVLDRFEASDAVIMAAAVADFRPAAAHPRKLKKEVRAHLVLELERTPDILAELGRRKGTRVLVGFAAETGAPAAAAKKKLREKNLDLVVANDVTLPGSGFDVDTNRVTIFTRTGRRIALPLLPKPAAADRILDQVAVLLPRPRKR